MRELYICSKCGYQHDEKDFLLKHEELCQKITGDIPPASVTLFHNVGSSIYATDYFADVLFESTIREIEVDLQYCRETNRFEEATHRYTIDMKNSINDYITKYSIRDEYVSGLFISKQCFLDKKIKNINNNTRYGDIVTAPLDPNTTYYVLYNGNVRQAVITAINICIRKDGARFAYKVLMYNEENNREKVLVNASVYCLYDSKTVMQEELKLNPEELF